MVVKDYISESDLELITRWMRKFQPNAMEAEKYLEPWAAYKSRNLVNIFDNQLILQKHIDIKKPSSVVELDIRKQGLYNDITDLVDSVINDLSKYLCYGIWMWDPGCDIAALDTKCKGTTFATRCGILNDYTYLFSAEAVAKNEIQFNIPKLIAEEYDITINAFQSGQKVFKALNYLIKILSKFQDVSKYMDKYETLRLKHSVALNDKKFEGTLCLSIHPLDYMTMSDNGYDWNSCMSWENDGCYHAGTIEMMNSPYVVIAYLAGDEPWHLFRDKTTTWSNKKWRELFIVHPNQITGIKGYPYKSPELEKICMDWLAELMNNHGYSINTTKLISGEDYVNATPDDEIQFATNLMYNDTPCGTVSYFADTVDINQYDEIYNYNNGKHHLTLAYSGPAYCVICGEWINSEQEIVCDECAGRYHCASCGDTDRIQDMIEVDGEYYCQECYDALFTTCPLTGETYRYDDGERLFMAFRNKAHRADEPSVILTDIRISPDGFNELEARGLIKEVSCIDPTTKDYYWVPSAFYLLSTDVDKDTYLSIAEWFYIGRNCKYSTLTNDIEIFKEI